MLRVCRCRKAAEADYETESDTDGECDEHVSDYKTQTCSLLVRKIKRSIKSNFQDVKHSIKDHLGIDTDDSNNEAEHDDGDGDEREEQPGCVITYSTGGGRDYTAEYVIGLRKRLQATLRGLEKAREEMRLWQDLHQRALEKYIFQPGLIPPPTFSTSHTRPECPGGLQAAKMPTGPPDTEPEERRRVVADRRAWELVHAAEMKLVEAERGRAVNVMDGTGNYECGGGGGEDPAGVDAWEAHVAMYRAELLVCEAGQCPESPGGWGYDERSECRVWDPVRRKKDGGVRADNWGTVPEYLRPLWYGGKRYN